jgi:beta-galactosidase/beta-glucuronidase
MHVIRLHGPWEYEPLARVAHDNRPLPQSGRVTLPADWSQSLGADFRGQVRFLRRFNCPTGLDHEYRVYLVVEGVESFGDVSLNGVNLGTTQGRGVAFRADITSQLALHNTLSIKIESLENPGGILGGIRLEIAEPT